jgi:ubiquinone/menaquinone biosynthesis C-methylase UbiE
MIDLSDMTGKVVLDVGTGSGRYTVELAFVAIHLSW